MHGASTQPEIDGTGKVAENLCMPTVAKSKSLVKRIEEALKIEAKEAVEIAVRYFREFFPELAGANVMLEEIEEAEDGKSWLITLGYDVKRSYKTPLTLGCV